MSRHPLLFLAVSILTVSGVLRPERAEAQPAGSAPQCVYDSGSFSEGAMICLQKGLAMTCSVAGERAVWKVVTDKEFSNLCVTPSRREFRMRSRSAARRHAISQPAATESVPPANASDKCFNFNGKRYCE